MRLEKRELSSYLHREHNFIVILGRGIKEYSPYIIVGALLGFGFGEIIYGSAILDQLTNPQSIEAARNQTEWYQYIAKEYAISSVILDHPREVVGFSSAIGAVGGLFARII